jgi:hypothetical protein
MSRESHDTAWTAEKKLTVDLAITTFVSPRHAVRMLELNRSHSRTAHRKLRNLLGHFDGFRAEWEQPYDPDVVSSIGRLPRHASQRDQWLVLSDGPNDGELATLDRLLGDVLHRDFGVLAINDPQHLAVFQSEEPRSLRVLFKPTDRDGSRKR